MNIIPREKAVFENLNSYYLDVRRLIEICQRDLGSGAIHFKSSSADGMVFFDKDHLVNGLFRDVGEEIEGMEAIDRIVEAADDGFTVSVYTIDPGMINFWGNLSALEEVYKNLTTELTDIEGMINKFRSEKFSGYFDISLGEEKESGLLFFDNGEFIGGSYSWGKGELGNSKEKHDLLVQKAIESGGIFNVMRVSLKKGEVNGESRETGRITKSIAISMLEELLMIFERMIRANKKIKAEFNTLFKKKLVETAVKYDFLDPFAADFQYSNEKITFSGDTNDKELAEGVIESVRELADELGILEQLETDLIPWFQKYSKELSGFGIS